MTANLVTKKARVIGAIMTASRLIAITMTLPHQTVPTMTIKNNKIVIATAVAAPVACPWVIS